MVAEFVRLFGAESILYLCADREFIGKIWFQWLMANHIAFRIRIRENTQMTNGRGELVAARRLFRSQAIAKPLALEKARRIWGLELAVTGRRLVSGEYLIVATSSYTATAIEEYAKRWEIETLFGCLKSRGFRLEEPPVIEPEHLKKLIALLALAFCWAHIVGEWLSQQKALKTKKHGRLAKNIFRYGLIASNGLLFDKLFNFCPVLSIFRENLHVFCKTLLNTHKYEPFNLGLGAWGCC